MSAVPRNPGNVGSVGLRMSADEFFALGETEERFELIDGVVVMSPSPTPKHQKAIRLLLHELERSIEALPGAEIFPDVDVEFSNGLVYRPDIVCFAPGRIVEMPNRLNLVPDLVIEVLSRSTEPFDLLTKREDYGRFGVVEFWVFDPADSSIRCWRRRGTQFDEEPAEGDTLTSGAIAGLMLDLRPLRAFARSG